MKKSLPLAFALFTAILLSLSMPHSGRAMWFGPSGIQDTDLDRDDESIHSPKHEIDHGSYGFWASSSEWVQVLDFSTPQIIFAPFTWSQVHWVPNSQMDWAPPISLGPIELPNRDQLDRALQGDALLASIASSHFECQTEIPSAAMAKVEAVEAKRYETELIFYV